MGISFKMGKGSVCGVYTSLKPMIHFDSKQSQFIFNQNYNKNAMANNCKRCSIRIISHTTTPLPKAYDCVAVYIAGRRTSLVVYGWCPQPPTKKPWDTQSKTVFKFVIGYGALHSMLRHSMSMFIKIISLYNPFYVFAILHPTSPANLVVEVGTRHNHQMLLIL